MRVDLPFDGTKAPARIAAVAWQWEEGERRWRRYVMRMYNDGSQHWSETYHLGNPIAPYCMQCLSNNVSPYSRHGDIVWYCCHDCDIGLFRITSV